MIDLHTHTLFSDGELLPSELAQRAAVLGLEGLAFTDHADMSNLVTALPALLRAAQELDAHHAMRIIAGVELTHLPPALIAPYAGKARALGAQIVVVHGESPVEPVAQGTNRAAIEAGVDILAHPGLITPEECALAAEKGVLLEISARGGHSLGNGRVARLGLAAGAGLVINTDAHAPRDLIDHAFAASVGLNAGLEPEQVEQCFANARRLLDRAQGVAV
ncbi:MAG: histidinol phosphate phosphatase domain-containing protein [Desulfarculaceae bacterium]|nr:histidinol phosphate phosphatase domain-containing protein [Desulfarculaceae bacterium]MCF8070930.1 histidinol phosphate phosphatase domain-containing protein [Desulfarculaceae bacterium]MCF8100518.1 histidinol phosphate phosphatase domain-containing protein [Desulfarculaceae bacterium]MCF8116544.1 histidinol phosphate phosphatase domain-containing protein [Desulfarculaceae bacterium]